MALLPLILFIKSIHICYNFIIDLMNIVKFEGIIIFPFTLSEHLQKNLVVWKKFCQFYCRYIKLWSLTPLSEYIYILSINDIKYNAHTEFENSILNWWIKENLYLKRDDFAECLLISSFLRSPPYSLNEEKLFLCCNKF